MNLKKFNDDGGTVVMVTHSYEADRLASHIINMKEGQMVSI